MSGSSWTRDGTRVSRTAVGFFIYCATRVVLFVFFGGQETDSPTGSTTIIFFTFFIISLVWILFSYIVEEHFVQWLDDKVKALKTKQWNPFAFGITWKARHTLYVCNLILYSVGMNLRCL